MPSKEYKNSTVYTSCFTSATISLIEALGEVFADEGTNFTPLLMQSLYKEMGIKILKQHPTHSKTNGFSRVL